jgi:hypothetical protein
MKRAAVLVAMLGLAGVGCDDDSGKIIMHDMAMKMHADANLGVPIGGTCMLGSDCLTGDTPTCIKKKNGTEGMCTAQCQADADCGDGNVCLFAPAAGSTTPGACAKSCQASTDCADGLGCWITLGVASACFPVDGVSEFGKALVLNCDPTAAGGCTFPNSNLPGGCERQILGSGSAGACRQGCEIGVGTCPNAPDGKSPQACYFIDNSIDSTGAATGDTLKQPICIFLDALIADGAECLDPSTGNHYFDICAAGSQCETYTTVAGATPDNICHQLCYLGNFSPPDAGALFGDGGIATGCKTGTCTDIFSSTGASAPSMPIGLCI